MRDQLLFFNSFVKRPGQVGAVAPSGKKLCRTLVDSFNWEEIEYAVEFGPGTGVVTELILERMLPTTGFFAVERNPRLAHLARQRCPDADVVEGCVTDIVRYCTERNFPHVDAVVSCLPWASFKASLQNEIFEAMFQVLKPQGHFATFAYLQGLGLPAGQRFSKLLKRNFSSVTKSRTVWKNLPPALVYRCVR
jgi:phosphatidylethanolamine/phosphatidyl-N-methylethanolamine N-methyltransferase